MTRTSESPSDLQHAAPNLTIARFGEVLAHVAFFGIEQETEIVQQLGYEAAGYAAAAAALRLTLADAVASDRPDLLVSYVSAYELTLRVLRARRPNLAHVRRDPTLEPTLSRRKSAVAPELSPLAQRASEAASEVSIPTYLKPPEPLMKPLAQEPAVVEETLVLRRPSTLGEPATPFVRAVPGTTPAPVSAQPPSARREDDPGSGTLIGPPPDEISRPVLPFRKT